MAPEPRNASGRDTLPKPMQERFPPRRRSLAGLWWALQTQLKKRKIVWEDHTGRYGYSDWIRAVERDQINGLLAQNAEIYPGDLSILFVIYGGDISQPALTRTLASLQQQGDGWYCLLFLPPKTSLHQETWFQEMLAAELRLGVLDGGSALCQSGWVMYQDAILAHAGDWLVALRSGDVLAESWRDLFAAYTRRIPAAEIIYWDEDTLTPGGERTQPLFKPDWSPELLYSTNYLGSAAFRRQLLERMDCADGQAGWIFRATGSARQVAHIPAVLQHCPAQTPEANARAQSAHAEDARAALEARGCGEVSVHPTTGENPRLRWTIQSPLVSIVIPTRNNLGYLKRCLTSLLERTTDVPFEIILMDDHSTDGEVLDYYQALQRDHQNLHLVSNAVDFNYSAVNNAGARLAQGELLLFLNNDVEIVDSGWLAEMVRWILLPEVGMVGAKLVYPDGTLQHAGIVVGMTGHAGHIYHGDLPASDTLFLSPEIVRNVSAVTGACMLVRRDLFTALGGFDEELVLVFNDVDLALRVQRAGYRVVYTPAATLIHYEGRSRARYMPPRDIRLGGERLSSLIQHGDPYYNPALSLAVTYPSLRRADEPPAAERLQKIVQYKG